MSSLDSPTLLHAGPRAPAAVRMPPGEPEALPDLVDGLQDLDEDDLLTLESDAIEPLSLPEPTPVWVEGDEQWEDLSTEELEAGPPQDWGAAFATVLAELGLPPGSVELAAPTAEPAEPPTDRLPRSRRAPWARRRPEIDLTPEEPEVAFTEEATAKIEPIAGADVPETAAWHRVRASAAGLAVLEASLAELDATADPIEACGRCLDRVLAAVPAESAAVLLHRPALAAFEFVAVRGPKAAALLGFTLPEAAGIAGQVRLEGRPAVLRDARQSPAHDRRVEHLTGYVTRGLLAVPLVTEGRVFGVIEVMNPFGGGSFLSWHQTALLRAAEALSRRLLR